MDKRGVYYLRKKICSVILVVSLTGFNFTGFIFFQSGRSRILPYLEWLIRPEPDFKLTLILLI